MGIQRLQAVSGGTDWSKYVPLTFHGTAINIPTSTTYTVTNVTGKGYLRYVTYFNTTANINSDLKITIDGVVKHLTTLNHNAYMTGIGPYDLVGVDASNAKIMSLNGAGVKSVERVLQYPTTSQGTGGFVLIDNPIFFNSSLKVEIINRDTTYALSAYVTVIGGLG